jgi:UDP-N-acetylglucosamine transferase subunit ALG13
LILVTLGTHPRPMDRLMVALDGLIADGSIADEVIIQAAAFGVRPRHAQLHGLVPAEQLWRWANDARVIVTHGGPASITLALSVGRRPVVVPRDPARGEHVDDHQIRFTRWIAKRRPIFVLEDPATGLQGALESASAAGVDPSIGGPPEQAIRRLRQIIENDR